MQLQATVVRQRATPIEKQSVNRSMCPSTVSGWRLTVVVDGVRAFELYRVVDLDERTAGDRLRHDAICDRAAGRRLAGSSGAQPYALLAFALTL
jgi:hypothetical protein